MTKRELSRHAAAAKMIRAALKAAYPTVRFKVTSSSFSGGDDVDIRWTDGPTVKEVDHLTRDHQQGHFDGSIDLYEYSNSRADIPQAKYVMTERSYSIDARAAAIRYVNKRYGWDLRYTIKHEPASKHWPAHTWLEIDQESNLPRGNGSGWQDSEVNSVLNTTSLLCRHCATATLPGDIYCPQCGKPLASDDQLDRLTREQTAYETFAILVGREHGAPTIRGCDELAAAYDHAQAARGSDLRAFRGYAPFDHSTEATT